MTIKVAHISTSTHGGAGIAAYRLHCALENGGEVSSAFVQKEESADNNMNIYSCNPYYPLLYRIKKNLGLTNDDKYTKQINKYPSEYELVSLPVAPFRIEDHPIVKEADIINLHWVGDFINYPSFFRKIKKPIVWTLHDMNPFLGIFHYEGDVNRNMNNLSLIDEQIRAEKKQWIKSNDNISIVCLSEWLKNKSEASDIFKQYAHYLIPNGLDFSNYPILDKKDSQNEFGLDTQKKNILFIAHGIDIYRKGFDILSKALNKLDHTIFNLISVGDGENADLNENINHIKLGRINSVLELNKIYSACDVVIIPSREDNLPNVMLESFANGTPIISFANGGMAEHIMTGKNGILIDEISSDALAYGISDFLNDKYLFDREIIRKYAEETFSSEQQVERYVKLYRNILSK